MAQVTTRRETIRLSFNSVDEGFDVHAEDDMLMIEAETSNGDGLDVLIDPELFPQMRKVMDMIDSRE